MKIFLDIKESGENSFFRLILEELKLNIITETYFFTTDEWNGSEESGQKAIETLVRLLDIWLIKTSSIKTNSFEYLPFDFSDQYLGLFQVENINENEFKVSYGYSEEHGCFYPSYSLELNVESSEYVRTSDFWIVEKILFINMIKEVLQQVVGGNSDFV